MRLRLLAAILLFVFNGPAPGAALTPAAMQEDLRYLRDVWSHTDRSLDDDERRSFDAAVDAVLSRTTRLSPLEFAFEISRAVAKARNVHSQASISAYLHGMPVGFAWFADGLHIVRAEPRYQELLGARVEKLGSLAPEEARAKVAPLISGNDAHIRVESAVFLRKLEVLHYIGASRDVLSATLRLRLRDGRARTVKLGEERSPDPARQPDWLGLVPTARDVPGRWVHVLDSAPQIPPLYRNVTNLDHEWWNDNRVFYLRSNRVWGTDQNRYELFSNLIGILQFEVAERRPKYAIVDLRLNHGGDFFNTVSFAYALPRLIPSDGRIFVLVGPDTGSAAISTAAMLKGQAPERVVLVGDTLGDDPLFWSEGPRFTLPNSGIVVTSGTKKNDWASRCLDRETCYWANTVFGPDGISLEPGIRVVTRFTEYAAGRDPVLEAVLSEAR
jgi:PAS domain-containing protein